MIVLDVDSDDAMDLPVLVTRELASAETPTIPEVIVVGISTANRRFHFTTPPPLDGPAANDPDAGGAPTFARFLESELYPFLAENYRTWPFVLVTGHSMTGLFAAYAFGHSPSFIDAAIAISPSLQWNGGRAAGQIAEDFRRRTAPGRFFVAAGASESTIPTAALRLEEKVRGMSTASKASRVVVLPDATHWTTGLQGLIDGLRFVFEPVSLSIRGPTTIDTLEKLASDEEMLAAYRAIREHYRSGAQTLGLPENLPDTFSGALALWLISSGRHKAGNAICGQAVQAYPDSWVGYDCLAFAYQQAADYSRAAATYRTAIELAERGGASTRNLTRLRRQLDRANASMRKTNN